MNPELHDIDTMLAEVRLEKVRLLAIELALTERRMKLLGHCVVVPEAEPQALVQHMCVAKEVRAVEDTASL